MSTFQTLFSQDIGRMNWRTVLDSFFSAFNQFRTISFIDIIDILIVAYIIYRIMKLLKDTSAERLIKGIIILVGIMLLASMLHLTMISWLLQQALNVGLFACADMSRTKTGALIVFERRERLGEIISTGTMVDAAPSAELIKNIFFKNSPLHDGAMIVRAGRVCAAGCVLPLSGNQSLSRDLGTRHRAAVGMSESADSVLVVVSEETGSISVAIGGMLKRHLSPDMLRKLLENELLDSEKQEKSRLAAIRDMWKGGAGK